jgi:hypothetical protein
MLLLERLVEWLLQPRRPCSRCIWRSGHRCQNKALVEMVLHHPVEHPFNGYLLGVVFPAYRGSHIFYRRRPP